jgi:hypothetical protein
VRPTTSISLATPLAMSAPLPVLTGDDPPAFDDDMD